MYEKAKLTQITEFHLKKKKDCNYHQILAFNFKNNT